MELERLKQEVADFIEREVERRLRKVNTDGKWEKAFTSIEGILEYEIMHTKHDIDCFENDGLTLNKLEQEGFLRGMLHILNLMQEQKGYGLESEDEE